MKNYKEFEKEFIGASDGASLILRGSPNREKLNYETWERESLKYLHFGADGVYNAYIVNGKDVEIGKHYEKVVSFKEWLKIYDDDGLTKHFRLHGTIDIYRAGEFGCIIHLKEKEKEKDEKEIEYGM